MQSPAAPSPFDARALDALRTQAARNPQGAARQAAVQFESLFTQMMLKSMREATTKAEGAGTGDTFTGMLDAQFAKQFAGQRGGLADMLEKQLTRHMQNLPAPSPSPSGGGPGWGRSSSATSTAPIPAPSSPHAADFLRRMLPHAREAERQTGVPASFILGQAALESGWGRAEARNADGTGSHNLFGIKATGGWNGATATAATTEYETGQPVRRREAFRSYASYTEAFADYACLLASLPRYAGALRGASSPASFAQGMQRAGYATDPAYASKLARTINQALALQRATG
ncbi:flagellar assembly peptidoglycan hydrolase FlgJ [Ramlibacter alkalitolerans]|uniref:Peptidoglycan hydrolase FlgJ n=1 Tax=Ramlibacter alkalitolerans TaxID=2039631 RepID=A0ABS1JKU7_9BURK|nr:flagellar assembly peptidoglycan hydrolase FlgJ [Ramlibacter alkalitolerans]MBL0424853.1 flagellar assembly peptidoglycan hydrolase FlgJ [Ramlibacter alkalitolerans]